MKKILQIILFAISFSHLSLGAFEIDKEKYLFGTLENPKYLSLWNALFENEENVDDWLSGYTTSWDGPSGPGENIIIDGREYLIRDVCKAHNCGNNFFVVAFSADGSEALGFLKRIKYVRDFDFNQSKFVPKTIRENRFFGFQKDIEDDHIKKLKNFLIGVR